MKAGILLLLAVLLLPLPLLADQFVSWNRQLFLDLFCPISGWPLWLALLTQLPLIIFWSLVLVLIWIYRDQQLGRYVLVSFVASFALVYTMKTIIGQPGPAETFGIVPLYASLGPSYPSGYTILAFGAAAALGFRKKNLLAPMLLLAALVGLSLIYIGEHFPYDVFSSVLLGTLVGYLISSFDLTSPRHHTAGPARRQED
jgi:undecaprenyl-diphosphatase